MSFVALTEGFIYGCKFFIGIYVMHLKRKYLGILLYAIIIYGEGALFPLVFIIIDVENNEN